MNNIKNFIAAISLLYQSWQFDKLYKKVNKDTKEYKTNYIIDNTIIKKE